MSLKLFAPSAQYLVDIYHRLSRTGSTPTAVSSENFLPHKSRLIEFQISAQRPFARRPIPPEILKLIFLCAVDFETRAVHNSCRLESDTARYLSQVCRQWREIALGSADIWRQALDPDSNTFLWAQVVLNRCNFQPLALVSAPHPSPSSVDPAKWNLVRSVYGQFKYIHVVISQVITQPDPRHLRALLSHPSPRLVDATVVWGSVHSNPESLPVTMTISRQPLFGGNAPNLRRLCLVNCPFHAYSSEAYFLFPSLRSLSLERTPGREPNYQRISLASILKTLQSSAFLTQLTLSSCIHGARSPATTSLYEGPQVHLPLLQGFTFEGSADVFLILNHRLALPVLCNKGVFLNFSSNPVWYKNEMDDLIDRCLKLVPIRRFGSMGVCVQYNHLYISFEEPGKYEIAFDTQQLHHDLLIYPNLARDICQLHPATGRYRDLDYLACAVSNWIMRHPVLYQDTHTFRFGSTTHGVSTMLMLYLLWAFPGLKHFHLANYHTLTDPDLLKVLQGETQASLPSLGGLQSLVLPLSALIELSTPSRGRDLDVLKSALKAHVPGSVFCATRRVEIAVSPAMLRLFGPNIGGVVEERVKGLAGLLSLRAVSWSIIDDPFSFRGGDGTHLF